MITASQERRVSLATFLPSEVFFGSLDFVLSAWSGCAVQVFFNCDTGCIERPSSGIGGGVEGAVLVTDWFWGGMGGW